MTTSIRFRKGFLLFLLAQAACRAPVAVPPAPVTLPARLSSAAQLVVVTTYEWSATEGRMQRFERESVSAAWRAVGAPVAIVTGRTGLAWGVGFDALDLANTAPHKHEGDGKSPAGAFPLDTVFGFAPAEMVSRLQMPYVALTGAHQCVDDEASQHYNTVLPRSPGAVDWSSAEHMRQVPQYRIGVIVGYNAGAPTHGRGSCIFLHIWNGPTSTTAGCTALDEVQLMQLIEWLDARKRPVMVQLTDAAYTDLRTSWNLPVWNP